MGGLHVGEVLGGVEFHPRLPESVEVGMIDGAEEFGRGGGGIGERITVPFEGDFDAGICGECGDLAAVLGDLSTVGRGAVGGGLLAGPNSDDGGTKIFSGSDDGFGGEVGVVAGAVVGPVGGDLESRIAGLLSDDFGGGEIAVGHVDIAAPFDSGYSRSNGAGKNLGDGKLSIGDRDEAGENHGATVGGWGGERNRINRKKRERGELARLASGELGWWGYAFARTIRRPCVAVFPFAL